MTATEAELNGASLYGDHFTDDQIIDWYKAEEKGYFNLENTKTTQSHGYGYGRLNHRHGFRHLTGDYPVCLALGCGSGKDIEAIAPKVGRFICIEPVREWWRSDIAGSPSEFRAPDPLGAIDLPDRSTDLAVSLGVLHHIPNVSFVFGEVARTLKQGGVFILREPISWMGDWRRPRRGLTANERGIPVKLLKSMAAHAGLRPISFTYCMTNALRIAAGKLGYNRHYDASGYVALDALVSSALSWNARYRRDTILSKIAPSCVFAVYRKQ